MMVFSGQLSPMPTLIFNDFIMAIINKDNGLINPEKLKTQNLLNGFTQKKVSSNAVMFYSSFNESIFRTDTFILLEKEGNGFIAVKEKNSDNNIGIYTTKKYELAKKILLSKTEVKEDTNKPYSEEIAGLFLSLFQLYSKKKDDLDFIQNSFYILSNKGFLKIARSLLIKDDENLGSTIKNTIPLYLLIYQALSKKEGNTLTLKLSDFIDPKDIECDIKHTTSYFTHFLNIKNTLEEGMALKFFPQIGVSKIYSRNEDKDKRKRKICRNKILANLTVTSSLENIEAALRFVAFNYAFIITFSSQEKILKKGINIISQIDSLGKEIFIYLNTNQQFKSALKQAGLK